VGRGRVCLSTAYWRVWNMEEGEEGRRYDTHFRNSKASTYILFRSVE
jgi:hypothetical protein